MYYYLNKLWKVIDYLVKPRWLRTMSEETEILHEIEKETLKNHAKVICDLKELRKTYKEALTNDLTSESSESYTEDFEADSEEESEPIEEDIQPFVENNKVHYESVSAFYKSLNTP